MMLFHCLDKGIPWSDATYRIKSGKRSENVVARTEMYISLRNEDIRKVKEAGEIEKPLPIVRWRQFTAITRGDFDYLIT
jgi:hypothetical protein